jgi:hypothetical protein
MFKALITCSPKVARCSDIPLWDRSAAPSPRSVAILPMLDLLRMLQPYCRPSTVGLVRSKPHVADYHTKRRINAIGGIYRRCGSFTIDCYGLKMVRDTETWCKFYLVTDIGTLHAHHWRIWSRSREVSAFHEWRFYLLHLRQTSAKACT